MPPLCHHGHHQCSEILLLRIYFFKTVFKRKLFEVETNVTQNRSIVTSLHIEIATKLLFCFCNALYLNLQKNPLFCFQKRTMINVMALFSIVNFIRRSIFRLLLLILKGYL